MGEVRVKRKYTKRSLTEGADVSKDEVARTKRKYTKRLKVGGGQKSEGLPEVPEGDVQPVEGDSQGVEVRKKRKYTKRKKPETDLEVGDVPVTPKKRGRPKLIKADNSVTNNLSDNLKQPEQAEASGPKTTQPQRLEEDVSKCGQLDIQVIPETGSVPQALSVSGKPDQEEAGQCKEWSTEVLENVSKGVFDFEDNTDGTASYAAETISSTNKKIEGEDSGLKIKRLEASSNSGDEQQVPLKITFKRPKQTEEEISSNVPRKSIKLRVKTQTTRDHGLKIQIRQPKTDNPLKFKVKTTKSKKAKKMESSNNSSPISTSTETSPTLTPTTASPVREHQSVAKLEQSDVRQMSEDGDHVPEAVVEDNSGSEAADQVDQDAKTVA